MKEIRWLLVDKDEFVISREYTREQARECKRYYEQNVFENWLVGNYKFPLKIIREQWELVDKKVVR